jgi:hypothetical protein
MRHNDLTPLPLGPLPGAERGGDDVDTEKILEKVSEKDRSHCSHPRGLWRRAQLHAIVVCTNCGLWRRDEEAEWHEPNGLPGNLYYADEEGRPPRTDAAR